MAKKITNWIAFSYSSPSVRIFNCNSIIFKNLSETLTIIINDIYIIKPSKERELRSQRGETDTTAYRFDIPSGATLQGWYKMDEGAYEDELKAIKQFLALPTPEFRTFAKQYRIDRQIPKTSIEKAFNMDITGYYGS